jgi:trehalose 6-phosphate synthase/phosphatase
MTVTSDTSPRGDSDSSMTRLLATASTAQSSHRPRRVIIASARLPVSVLRRADTWDVAPSPGGLATALRSVADGQPVSWFGLPGSFIPESDRSALGRKLSASGCSPVFGSRAELEGFSEGFSNGVLWPLFHGLAKRAYFDLSGWKAYQALNARFADAIAAEAMPEDRIWVHDYQLALVPELLRQRGVECPVGFFLHVPFPSAEAFRRLPLREELLRGVLGADLIGFHTYEYVSQFLGCCLRVLGLECEPELIRLPHRDVHVAALPVGIDPDEIRLLIAQPEIEEELSELESAYRGKRVIVGVDRLDYTKGIPEKLHAFEELLRTKPEWRGRVVLIQVGAPTRAGASDYEELRREVEELVGRINGRYGTPSFSPVVYVGRNLPRERLIALYRRADVALVTPLRDGMNLVALEYVVAREGRGGALLLSEFAGAAHWLAGARLVNPYSISRTAEALELSLEGTPDAPARYEQMLRFVRENTAERWGEQFLARLEAGRDCTRTAPEPLAIGKAPLASRVRRARRPLVLLDYDGTLRAFEKSPDQAEPDARLRTLLFELAKRSVVYIVSGRKGATLERWLGDLGVGLVCEHGLSIKRWNGAWEKRARVSGKALKRTIEPLLRDFVRRTPGSLLERKTASIAWHYRAAEPEFAAMQARLLIAVLDQALRRRPYEVLRGSRVIEVRHRGVSKARALSVLLELHRDADLLFCAGDDTTDDEMMAAIPAGWRERAITCSVGTPRRSADYFVDSTDALLGELEEFVRLIGLSGSKRGSKSS